MKKSKEEKDKGIRYLVKFCQIIGIGMILIFVAINEPTLRMLIAGFVIGWLISIGGKK